MWHQSQISIFFYCQLQDLHDCPFSLVSLLMMLISYLGWIPVWRNSFLLQQKIISHHRHLLVHLFWRASLCKSCREVIWRNYSIFFPLWVQSYQDTSNHVGTLFCTALSQFYFKVSHCSRILKANRAHLYIFCRPFTYCQHSICCYHWSNLSIILSILAHLSASWNLLLVLKRFTD